MHAGRLETGLDLLERLVEIGGDFARVDAVVGEGLGHVFGHVDRNVARN